MSCVVCNNTTNGQQCIIRTLDGDQKEYFHHMCYMNKYLNIKGIPNQNTNCYTQETMDKNCGIYLLAGTIGGTLLGLFFGIVMSATAISSKK